MKSFSLVSNFVFWCALFGFSTTTLSHAQQNPAVPAPRAGCLRWDAFPSETTYCRTRDYMDFCPDDEILVQDRLSREGRVRLHSGRISSIDFETKIITVRYGHSRSFGFRTSTVRIDLNTEAHKIFKFSRFYRDEQSADVPLGPNLFPIYSEDDVDYWLEGHEPHGRDLPLNLPEPRFTLALNHRSSSYAASGKVSGVFYGYHTALVSSSTPTYPCNRQLAIYVLRRAGAPADEFDFAAKVELIDASLRVPVAVANAADATENAIPLPTWEMPRLDLDIAGLVNSFWAAGPRAPLARPRHSLFTEQFITSWVVANSHPGQLLRGTSALFNRSFSGAAALSTMFHQLIDLPLTTQSMATCARTCIDNSACASFQMFLRPNHLDKLTCTFHRATDSATSALVPYERPVDVPADVAQVFFLVTRPPVATAPDSTTRRANLLTEAMVSTWMQANSHPGQPLAGASMAFGTSLSGALARDTLLSEFRGLPANVGSLSRCRELCMANENCSVFQLYPERNATLTWACTLHKLEQSQLTQRVPYVRPANIPQDAAQVLIALPARVRRLQQMADAISATQPMTLSSQAQASAWIARNAQQGQPFQGMRWAFNTFFPDPYWDQIYINNSFHQLSGLPPTTGSILTCRNLCMNEPTCNSFYIYYDPQHHDQWFCYTLKLTEEQFNTRQLRGNMPNTDVIQVLFTIPSRN